MNDIKKLLEFRAEMKKKKPHFKRHDRNKLGRLARSGWRSSVMGHDNKQRNKYAGNERMPSPGYGSPAEVRGMHPSGFAELIVHNSAELEGVDAKKFAIRIGGTVGNRKRIEIVEKAKKMNFKVLNPAYEIKAPKAKAGAKAEEKGKKEGSQKQDSHKQEKAAEKGEKKDIKEKEMKEKAPTGGK